MTKFERNLAEWKETQSAIVQNSIKRAKHLSLQEINNLELRINKIDECTYIPSEGECY